MILFDTETTGLPFPDATPLDKQPHIIEFCAIKLDDKTLKETGKPMEFLCDPGISLPEVITKITGLTDGDLRGKGAFGARVPELIEYFLGERTIVAHNLKFDLSLMSYELRRVDWHFRFPWPPNQICTVEKSFHIQGRRLKLFELHQIATGKPEISGAHRAINDVRAMAECVRYLRKQGAIK